MFGIANENYSIALIGIAHDKPGKVRLMFNDEPRTQNVLETADIQVSITRPLIIGRQVHPGDALLSQGTTYGTPQIVESLFTVSSSASASSIQASKTIRADISLYPQVLSIIPQ